MNPTILSGCNKSNQSSECIAYTGCVSPQIPPQFVTEADRLANIENPTYTTWELQDQLLLAWLQASLSTPILPSVIGCRQDHLSQAKYIRDILHRARMEDCKGISTPLPANLKLSKTGTDLFEDLTLYRSIVGALQYVTITRPELGYSVNKVCQFLYQPLVSHWSAVKRILRYLKGSIDLGLTLQPATTSPPININAFCDADWASDIDDRRSTSGACIYLGPNLVSWWSRKQTLVAKSSAEAEYRSLALAASEVLWLQSLLHELKVSIPAPVIYCGNQSTVSLSHNPVLHSRTKHMELDIFFVHEKVLNKSLGKINLLYKAIPQFSIEDKAESEGGIVRAQNQ